MVSVLYCAHSCMKCSLISPMFLKSSLVFPILLFSSISVHCSFKKAFLSLLAILWNSTFSWVYLSLSPFPFPPLLSSAICKASLDNHFALLDFFLFGMVLVTASCTMLWTSIHSSSKRPNRYTRFRWWWLKPLLLHNCHAQRRTFVNYERWELNRKQL